MKLTEAVQFRQPLFESFKDLKGVIEREVENAKEKDDINDIIISLDGFENTFNDIQEIEGGDEQYFYLSDTKNIVNAIRYILQHELSDTDLDDVMKSSKNGQGSRLASIFRVVTREATNILQKLGDPARQDPDYDTVDKGKDYTVYQLNNYSSARKMCNAFGTSHCIGSSDTSMFDSYGPANDRDTFAIATSNKRLVIVHSGGNGFLITSHDNNNEVSDESNRGKGMDAIIDDLNPPLDFDTIREIFNDLIDDEYHQQIKDIIDTHESPIDEDTGIILDEFPSINDAKLSLRKQGRTTYLHIFVSYLDGRGRPDGIVADYTAKDGDVYEIINGAEYRKSNPAATLASEMDADVGDLRGLVRDLEMTGNEVAEEMADAIHLDM